jgi:RHS repeat-associated protein
VVEPDPNGNGSVATGGMKTNYSYDTLGNLMLVTQGDQTRSFKYDALNRLTHQKLAERDATLNDAGVFVATRNPSQPIYSGGVWSDVFTYDQRSNLTQRVDARGVKTTLNYNNDPLNRLQSVAYDKSGVPAVLLNDFPIPDAPSVTYAYVTTGDKNRLQNYVVSSGVGNETFVYDGEGRLAQTTQTFAGREGYPLAKNYVWDSLNRVKELYYPVQYGGSGLSKKVETTYDIANRLDSLKFDGMTFASNPVYNAASQVESLNVGSFKQETYAYDPQTGLLVNQQVKQGANINLTLGYSYAQNPDMGNNGPKTGQLTRVFDPGTAYFNRNNYYDTLGRLKEVRAGIDSANPSWKQTYTYDRYGNRTSVTKSGPGSGSVPLDGLASLSYTNGQGQTVNNRITTAGYVYDPAGNQTRGESASGTWLRYRYDAAGRLADVRNDSDQSVETYSYGASNNRLKTDYFGGAGAPPTYYVWDGGQVICDFRGSQFSPALGWEKFYVYMGGRLLATVELVGGTKYHHPDRLGTRLVSDAATGAITTSQTNLPYGTALETSGSATNRRFTSYDRSAWTGMDYAVNRFYNAAQGRFTQVDPIGMAAARSSDPQSMNLYSYCGNDPINRMDPDGLFWGKLFGWIGKIFKWIAIAAVVAIAVLTIAPGAWAGTLMAKISIWTMHHQILASLLGLHTPQWAIVNFASIEGAAAAGFWVLAGAGAVNSLLSQKAGQARKTDKKQSGPCSTQSLVKMMLQDLSKDGAVKKFPYLNMEVANAFNDALLEIEGGIGFTEVFRTTAHQTELYNRYLEVQREWDSRSALGRLGRTPPVPARPPGTSAHEAGVAFDLPGQYLTQTIIDIFAKHGFVRAVPNDPVHFEWSGWSGLSAADQANMIKAAQDYYNKCLAGR